MSQENLRKSATQCEVIFQHPYEFLRIDYHSECCRVTSHDNYIKAECFSPKGNHKFRIRIEIESVADDELSRPQQEIVSNTYAEIESNTEVLYEQIRQDYATCQHIWTITSDGHTICRKCGNIKLTRKMNAASG